MLNTKFAKYSGAGNDFVIFLKEDLNERKLTQKDINRICDRRFGVGADGLIILSSSETCDFEMQYFNADGNAGSLCGNGARCAIKHAHISGLFTGDSAKFIVADELYSGNVLEGGNINFLLNNPSKIKKSFKIKAHNQLIESAFADTGSPHVVINCSDVLRDVNNLKSGYENLKDFPVLELGAEIRYHNDFAPAGTNVNFIELDENKLKIRTYERGVENETLACGTGSVASALIAGLSYGYKSPVSLQTFGGDYLTVDFEMNSNGFTNISLTGPAVKVFEGKILL